MMTSSTPGNPLSASRSNGTLFTLWYILEAAAFDNADNHLTCNEALVYNAIGSEKAMKSISVMYQSASNKLHWMKESKRQGGSLFSSDCQTYKILAAKQYRGQAYRGIKAYMST